LGFYFERNVSQVWFAMVIDTGEGPTWTEATLPDHRSLKFLTDEQREEKLKVKALAHCRAIASEFGGGA